MPQEPSLVRRPAVQARQHLCPRAGRVSRRSVRTQGRADTGSDQQERQVVAPV